MNLEDFKSLVSIYGANPEKWPEFKRAAAEDFAANNKETVDPIVLDAQALDSALSILTPPPPSDLLQRRIMARLDRQPEVQKVGAFLKWRSVAALAACAFGLGFAGAQFMPSGESSAGITYEEASSAQENWQLAAGDLGLEEVYSWVEGGAVSSDGLY